MNKKILERIKENRDQGMLSHAYIVTGGTYELREKFALDFAKTVFCDQGEAAFCQECVCCKKIEHGNFEDLTFLRKEGAHIKVEQISELIGFFSRKPFSADCLMAVIVDSDDMTPESQNKLLKTLEELNPGNVLVLLCENADSLYPTVRSRCVTIRLKKRFPDIDSSFNKAAQDFVSHSIMKKPIHDVYTVVESVADSVDEANKLLEAIELFLRDVIITEYDYSLLNNEENKPVIDRINRDREYPFKEFYKHVNETHAEIDRGMNWKYSIKNLIIKMQQEELNG